MNRLQLVSALALSVGVTGWFNLAVAEPLSAHECDHSRSGQCHCASGNGLLDSLDHFATKMSRGQSRRPSILSVFTNHHSRCDTGCDNPACRGEATCGCEPTCGTESNCTTEPSCGVGTSCATATPRNHAVPLHSAGPQHSASPQHSAVPQHSAPPQYNHSLGPIQYPPTARPDDPRVIPNQILPGPLMPALPRVPQPERIPVPTIEDSTIDPFRDDTASRSRPTRLRVQPASQRILRKVPQRLPSKPAMSFDPQSLSVPVPHPAVSGQKPKSRSIAAKWNSSRRSAGARQSISDDTESAAPESSVAADQAQDASVDTRLEVKDSSVIQAGAVGPARLPALKTARPVEQSTVDAPGTNEHAVSDATSIYNPLRGN